MSTTHRCPRCSASIAVPLEASHDQYMAAHGWRNAVSVAGGPTRTPLPDGRVAIVAATEQTIRLPAWHCGLTHARETAIRIQRHAAPYSLDASGNPHLVRSKPADPPKPAERTIACARSGCATTMRILPRDLDDPDRLRRVSAANGWHFEGGRLFCCRTCAELLAVTGGRRPVKPTTRDDLARAWGKAPESYAARRYAEIHGANPDGSKPGIAKRAGR